MDTALVNPSLAAATAPEPEISEVDLINPDSSRADKKKRYHNKSKNGCRTCKSRRVKCDEGRPGCQRCRTFGFECDGYDEPFQPKAKTSHGQVFVHRRARVVPQVQPSAVSLCRSPQQSMFKNDQEHRYFSLFSTKTATQLKGLFPTDLWDRLVLQVSERDSSVRHAVIALGALDPQTWKSPTKSWKDISRRKFAYHEYSMAIVEMKKAISQKTLDLRTRLIACIVFVTFEVYHRNTPSAVAQIENMSSLIGEKLRDQNIYTPTSTAIDNELLESFRDLEIQNLVNNSFGRPLTERDLLDSRQSIRKKLPQEFVSLHQARAMFHVIVIRQLHWQNTCKHEWPWWATPQTIGLFALQNDPPSNEVTTTEEWCAERDRRFEEYTAWWNAFQPLLLKARLSNDPHELRRAEIVRMTYLGTYLALMTRMLSPWESWYGQTARLAELIALVKHLLAQTEDTGFSIEMNFLIPLIIVAKMFRHRVLRKEAIRLMFAYPRREGLWDGVLVAKSLQWVAELEEDGMGDEEEYVSYFLATDLGPGTEIDPVRRSAKLVAYQRPRDAPMTVVKRETFVTW
ncbi:hypothetical protein N431DRAFT_425527 [Stipitochalara longipes BDJ]|nr:hypothetical protein N431DRAFT_425527 [Stipitochalara longipes BDJ]